MKIVTVVGARPQFIKAAAVSREIEKHPAIKEVIIHTGQHFDHNMSDIFFEEMEIPRPDYCLEINSLGHGAMTGRMLEKIEEVLLKEKPDFVMVYGDTNSTLAGALAAKKMHIKVVHVEAGLRSFNMRMPEEVNRILTDRISDILCCPTISAMENLKIEAFDSFSCEIVQTGDVMHDAARYYATLSADRSTILKELDLMGKDFALCTVHRAENTDVPERLSGIVNALNTISNEMPVVLPLHPRTRKLLAASPVKLDFMPVEPVGYFDMLELLKSTQVVLTDSGGLQKEAFFFRKPCVTLRDETEWVELVALGVNRLAGTCDKKIIEAVSSFIKEKNTSELAYNKNIYGDGNSAKLIIESILVIHNL